MKSSLLRDAIRRALFAGAALAVAMPLLAQDTSSQGPSAEETTTDAADASPASLDKVTVTGSRIQRAVDAETVQPVTVITRE